jgi:hypothetical protein
MVAANSFASNSLFLFQKVFLLDLIASLASLASLEASKRSKTIIEKKRFSRLLNYFLFLLELSGKFKTKRNNSNPIQIIEEQK